MKMKAGSILLRSLVTLTTILCFSGCVFNEPVQPPVYYPVTPQTSRGKLGASVRTELAQAENLCKEKKFDKCIEAYEKLLAKYPNDPSLTPQILQGLQEADLKRGKFSESIEYGKELTTEFPNYPELSHVRINIVQAYLDSGDSKFAIKSAHELWPFLGAPSDKSRLALLISKAFLNLKDPLDAFFWAVEGWILTTDMTLKNKLEAQTSCAISLLDEKQIRSLLTDYAGRFPEVWLRARLVGLLIDDGKLEEASEKLHGLEAQFPNHPAAIRFKELEDILKEQSEVDPLSIGCILPLTGPLQPYGRRLLRGLYMAEEFYNLSTWGEPIRLVVKDSHAPGGVTEAVDELVHDHHSLAIIGPLSRKIADDAAKEAERLRIPILTLTQKESVVETGKYVFRIFITAKRQVQLLAAYSVFDLGFRSLAILHPDDSYGAYYARLFSDQLDRLGIKVNATSSYDTNTTDFTQAISQLFTSAGMPPPTKQEKKKLISILTPPPFEGLFIPDQVQTASLIASQLAYNDVVGVRIFGTNLWNTPKLEKEYAPYLEGAVFVDGFFADSMAPEVQQFVEQFEATYDTKPQYLEAQAYDALNLILAAKKKATYQRRGALREALLGIKKFRGVTGTMSVLASGDVKKSLFLLAVRNGKVTEMMVDQQNLLKKLEKESAKHTVEKTKSTEKKRLSK